MFSYNDVRLKAGNEGGIVETFLILTSLTNENFWSPSVTLFLSEGEFILSA